MNTRILLAALAMIALAAAPALAADHLDSPSVRMNNGQLDINDIYAFVPPSDTSHVVLVMTVNPAAGVISQQTTFDQRATYEFHVALPGSTATRVLFQVQFSAPDKQGVQRYIVRRNGALIARGLTGQDVPVRLRGGGMVRCDVFEDPFFFDLDGFNNGFAFTGKDFFAGLNVSAIVLELPIMTAGNNDMLGLWARTVVQNMQVDRMGRPAISTALIPNGGDKDAFNRSHPANDAQFAGIINSSIAGLSSQANADALTPVLLPDLLTIDTSQPTAFLNGRALADDVIDAELELLSAGAVTTDMVDSNDAAFLGVFPYLAPPNGSAAN